MGHLRQDGKLTTVFLFRCSIAAVVVEDELMTVVVTTLVDTKRPSRVSTTSFKSD